MAGFVVSEYIVEVNHGENVIIIMCLMSWAKQIPYTSIVKNIKILTL